MTRHHTQHSNMRRDFSPGITSIKILLLLGLLAHVNAEGKSVRVDVRSNWPATSLVQEMSEFFASESNDLFWRFVDVLRPLEGFTEKDQFESASTLAANLTSPVQAGLLQYAIAYRYFSPKVQAHRQVAALETTGEPEDIQKKLAGNQDHPVLTAECPNWLKISGRIIDDFSKAEAALSAATVTAATLTPLDHVYNSHDPALPTAFLYGCIGTPEFVKYHDLLKSRCRSINYVFRHSVPMVPGTISIPGYGVELAIKSLEYKTVDDANSNEGQQEAEPISVTDETTVEGFKFGTLLKRKPEAGSDLSNFRAFLQSSEEKMEDLKVWNLKNLAFQAAQRIISDPNPLQAIADISGNFPARAAPLTKLKLNETMKRVFESSSVPDTNIAIINGKSVDPSLIQPFELYEILREQATRMESLRSLGISTDDVSELLSLAPGEATKFTFKVISPAITFINDLETEPKYKDWNPSLNELYRRVWPGNFRYIRKNLHTAVIFLDPSNSLEMFSYLNSLISQNIPIRYGLVFSPKDKLGRMITTMFYYVAERSTKREATAMLGGLYQRAAGLTEEFMMNTFQNTLNKIGSREKTAAAVIEQDPYSKLIEEGIQFTKDFGVTDLPLSFVNGVPISGGLAHELMNNIIHHYFQTSTELANMLAAGQISDETKDLYSVIVGRPGTLDRYSGTVLPSPDRPIRFVNLASRSAQKFLNNDVKYATDPATRDETKFTTHLIVTDFSTIEGLQLALEAIRAVESSGTATSRSARIGMVHNGKTASHTFELLHASQASQLGSKMSGFLLALLQKSVEAVKEGAPLSKKAGEKLASDFKLNLETLRAKMSQEEISSLSDRHRSFVKEIIQISDGSSAVVTNGRVVEIAPGTEFNHLDYELLTRFEYNGRIQPVENAFQEIKFQDIDADVITGNYISNAIMATSSLLGIDESNDVQKMSVPAYLPRTLVVDSTGGNVGLFQIVVVLDPLSRDAQRLPPLLEVVKNIFPCRIEVILRPTEQSNLPLKTFYASALTHQVGFDSQGRVAVVSPKLDNIPPARLLTLALDTPEPWLVGPTLSKYDLDNIKLQDLGKDKSLVAVFELQSITLQGNCADKKGNPPRGLQVVLGTEARPVVVDTLVMANLGYFQLKANPGVWSLKIKPNSRSEELYDIIRTGQKITELQVVVSSFNGETVPLKVAKKIEKFSEELLVEGDSESSGADTGVWNSLSGLWNDKKSEETIHVFSLASGHLYERFLKIMMLSVVKNTKNPVKFWLLANFLSPKFKDTVPALAQEYKFEFELVTYKWPAWLFAQTEKQRIIWAYKILFLDVLFPLDVKKVIYVDADQVVRADLKELWDLDLHGAPYGYTPFCDSNKATEGFRFWKKGFWESHLRGLPYHISALYVVDLFRFRQIAAGDQLRATYSQLAPDPNSLSNLDQDLPNYVQHNLKIFSLPQEWLWCETWCSNSTKSKAKTIDLCNNPLTKTPKLEAAVKIIPEWNDLDNEVKKTEKEATQSDDVTLKVPGKDEL